MISFTAFTKEQKEDIDNRTKKIEYSISEEQKRQMPFTSWLYLVETRLCYIFGMDVACIMMMMATFEELFRILNSLDDYKKNKNSKSNSDSRKFVELLEIARLKKWITENEFQKIDELRKKRNKFTHIKKANYRNGQPDLDDITRESMIAEIFQPSVDFDGLAEQSVELIPIIFNVLDRTESMFKPKI